MVKENYPPNASLLALKAIQRQLVHQRFSVKELIMRPNRCAILAFLLRIASARGGVAGVAIVECRWLLS